MKRLMMTVVAAIACLTMSAEKEMMIPAMGCEEQTVVKMLGAPAEVNGDGTEVVYHDLTYKGIRWDRVTIKYEKIGNLKMMKSCTLTESCRNAQEAFDLNAALQLQLRHEYGWLDANAVDEGWMSYQGGETFGNGGRYAFTLSTQKKGKTHEVCLAICGK
jgi:hypothetical protein